MPSFDIVNEVNLQEVDNAVNITKKVIETRFDFRGSETEIELDKKGKKISVLTADTMKMDGIKDVLATNLVKRHVSPKCLEYGDVEPTSKGAVKMMMEMAEMSAPSERRARCQMTLRSEVRRSLAATGYSFRRWADGVKCNGRW